MYYYFCSSSNSNLILYCKDHTWRDVTEPLVVDTRTSWAPGWQDGDTVHSMQLCRQMIT